MAADYLVVATGGAPLWIGTASLAVTGGVSAPPSNTVAPAISGTVAVGQTLTCSTGTWTNSPSYAYQWQRATTSGGTYSNVASGGTSSTYVLQTGDATYYFKCVVTATNAAGSASADSNSVGPVAAAGDPTGLPLAQSTDFSWLGYFPVPSFDGVDTTNPHSFDFANGGLSIAPDGTSLYITGHREYNVAGRISIPTDLTGATSATVITTLRAVPGTSLTGNTSTGSGVSGNMMGGSLVYNSRVIFTKYMDYDDGTTTGSHLAANLALTSFNGGAITSMSDSLPAMSVPTSNPRYAAGFMCNVPTVWQTPLGGPALSGGAGMNIASQCSHGPGAAFSFDPDDVGVVSPIPSNALLYYTSTNYLAGTGTTTQNDYWNGTTTIAGMGIIPGTRTLVYLSTHGTGPCTYHTAADACRDAGGYNAYPYRHQAVLYDLNDLAAAKAGTVNPYDIVPYAVFELPDNGLSCPAVHPGGACFDPATNRFYLMTRSGSGGTRIDVYQAATF